MTTNSFIGDPGSKMGCWCGKVYKTGTMCQLSVPFSVHKRDTGLAFKGDFNRYWGQTPPISLISRRRINFQVDGADLAA